MPRPVLLFSGQWTAVPLEELAQTWAGKQRRHLEPSPKEVCPALARDREAVRVQPLNEPIPLVVSVFSLANRHIAE